mgnify:CR=1 FL=1
MHVVRAHDPISSDLKYTRQALNAYNQMASLAGREGGSGPAQPRAPQFVQWVYETYRDQLRLPETEGSRKFHEFIESMDIETLPLSGTVRVMSFHIIRFGYPMRRAGYSTVAFSVRVMQPDATDPTSGRTAPRTHEALFAYAYWPREQEGEEPEYICLSPTYESRDGEYRNRFLWFRQFFEGYEALDSLLSPLEQLVLELIRDGVVSINLYLYPGDGYGAREGPISYIESTRLGVKALVASFALDHNRLRDGTMENHSSKQYSAVLHILYEYCAKCFSVWDLETYRRLSVFKTGKEYSHHRAQCGQKIIPLTIRESLQVNDINYAPWREVWVNQRATELVINGIAPMFPIYNNWTYLDGIDRSLFENKAMHERYDRSTKAGVVSKSLRKARDEIGDITDYRTGQLDAHIYDSIIYAQEHVLLTNLAMCSTSEYVGVAIRSIPDVVRRSEIVGPEYLRIFSNPAMQGRYLFDLCYGAHMLHTRVGAIHSDLHLNNMTMLPLGSQYITSLKGNTVSYTKDFTNPTIAYVAGPRGEADTYVFPHDGLFACLIDFSRAILGPAARPKIVVESGEAFASGFYRNQVSRALRVLHHYIPAFTQKNQEKIKGLLLAEPDIMFDVMTAVDFIAIGRNYGALLRATAEGEKGPGDERVIEVAPEGVALASRIEDIALEHLVLNLTELVGGVEKRGVGPAGNLVLPGAFDEFRYSSWAGEPGDAKTARPYRLHDARLTDAYNATAPLEYSSTDYERFPPWAKFDELERHLGDIDIAQVTSNRGERPFLQSRDLSGYIEVLQEQVRKRAQDAPAAETSSWIAE